MKYFKDGNAVVYAFAADGSEDDFIKADLVPMTAEEIDSHLNPAPVQPSVVDLCIRIDGAADALRYRIAADPLRAVEYAQAEADALAFAAAGYPADTVPRAVAAWAVNGRTAQDAATEILVEAGLYREAFYTIRERRLQAKEDVRRLVAAGKQDQALQVTESFINTLQADFAEYAA